MESLLTAVPYKILTLGSSSSQSLRQNLPCSQHAFVNYFILLPSHMHGAELQRDSALSDCKRTQPLRPRQKQLCAVATHFLLWIFRLKQNLNSTFGNALRAVYTNRFMHGNRVGRVFTNGKVRAAITALFFDFIAANGENPSVHRKHVQTENEAFGWVHEHSELLLWGRLVC